MKMGFDTSRDQLFALCHLVREESPLRSLRLISEMIMDIYGAQLVALFSLDEAENKLVIEQAVKRGDSHFATPSLAIELTHERNGSICPLSQPVFTGQRLVIARNFGGYDMKPILDAIALNLEKSQIGFMPIFGGKGKVIGACIVQAHSENPCDINTVGQFVFDTLGFEMEKILKQRSSSTHLANMSKSLEKLTASRAAIQRKLKVQRTSVEGSSQLAQNLREEIALASGNSDPAVIVGRDGSNRQRIARDVHESSEFHRGSFIYVNAERFTPQNLYTEFLGYKRGAIEGVNASRRGLFREASGGTLYIENLDRANEELQKLLIRYLDTGVVRAFGSERDVEVKTRLIISVPPNTVTGQEGGLLPSLMHKLSANVIEVPSISSRREDLPTIIHSALKSLNETHRSEVKIEPSALAYLVAREYEGELREVKAVIERLFLQAHKRENALIVMQDLDQNLGAKSVMESNWQGKSLKEKMENFERTLILETLQITHGNRADAADSLGIPKRTLADKCKKYAI